MTTDRSYTFEEARRLLVARIRADREFAEALITDPARTLAGVDLAALFGPPAGDEAEEVRGYAQGQCQTLPIIQC